MLSDLGKQELAMLVEFVNHASLIVTAGNVRLIADPWLEGRVFHDGWDLVASSVMTFEDFKDITHIWFSHEHPDHFLPDNLKKISPQHRQAIEVLFQETRDKKVIRYCRGIGFGKVTELRPQTWIKLDDQMHVMNCPNDTNWLADSWLCIRSPTGTLLNLNDCGASDKLHAIKKFVGKVDVLATQFSYAQWINNYGAVQRRLEHDRDVLETLKLQIEVLKPRYVIPFASFSWFCTEDNFYLNSEKNKIGDVCEYISQNTKAEPIAMYPGDRWIVGEPHETASAIARYERDMEQIADPTLRPRTQRERVDATVLAEAGQSFRRRLNALTHPLLVRARLASRCYRNRSAFRVGRLANLAKLAMLHVEPARLFVTDLGQAFTMDLNRGLQGANIPRDACDIMLSSASLLYCLKFDWGGETLYVNGCFQENDNWKDVASMAYPERFFKYCSLLRRADLGEDIGWGATSNAIMRRLGRRRHRES
jgi:L-ascorbate metabolism protein UlaG (beta-lactamase superfamily)